MGFYIFKVQLIDDNNNVVLEQQTPATMSLKWQAGVTPPKLEDTSDIDGEYDQYLTQFTLKSDVLKMKKPKPKLREREL